MTFELKFRNLLIVAGFCVLLSASICLAGQPLKQLVTLERLSSPKSLTNNFKPASAAGKYLAGRHAHLEQNFNIAAKYLSEALTLDPTNSQILQKTFFSSGLLKLYYPMLKLYIVVGILKITACQYLKITFQVEKLNLPTIWKKSLNFIIFTMI